MLDYIQARTNMLDSQIHTSGVVNPDILEAFQNIPREMFVPEAMRGVAYNDEDITLGHGRYLLEPVVHARMLQALDPKKDDVVLDVLFFQLLASDSEDDVA